MSTPADTSTTFVLPDAPETSRTSCVARRGVAPARAGRPRWPRALDGAGLDGYDQGVRMFTAHPRSRCSRPDPDRHAGRRHVEQSSASPLWPYTWGRERRGRGRVVRQTAISDPGTVRARGHEP